MRGCIIGLCLLLAGCSGSRLERTSLVLEGAYIDTYQDKGSVEDGVPRMSLEPIEFIEDDICLCALRVRGFGGMQLCRLYCYNTGNLLHPFTERMVVVEGDQICIPARKGESIVVPVCAKPGFKTLWRLTVGGKDFVASVLPRPLEVVFPDGAKFEVILREVGGNLVEAVASGLDPGERVTVVTTSIEGGVYRIPQEASAQGRLASNLIWPREGSRANGRSSVELVRESGSRVLEYEIDKSTVKKYGILLPRKECFYKFIRNKKG